MNRRILGVLTLVAVVLIVVSSILYFRMHAHGPVQSASQAPVAGKAQINKAAPQFEVDTTAGLFDLSKTAKPVFLEVFATWCPHCQHETPIVDKLFATYRSRVDFVAVSGSDTAMDGTSPSSENDVVNWIRRFNVRYPVAYDPILNVANLYLQGGFPTFAIIDSKKKIRYLEDGEVSYAELDAALRAVLR
ncbi:MAG: redoxin family protein [Candidatus Cybelea sp.]|jgi:cytochrome c biogenesis protein CcmG/thiol:disulfide interchange protein DsbE